MAHDRDDQSYNPSAPYPSHEAFPDPRQYQPPPPPPPPPSVSLNSPTKHYPEPVRTRSRASTNASRQGPDSFRPQPVYDAVNDAFGNSAAASQVPDEIIRQITEQVRSQVIDSLKAEGFAAPPTPFVPPPTQQPFQPPPTSTQPKQSLPSGGKPAVNGSPRRTGPSPPPMKRRDSSGSDPPAQDPFFYSADSDAKAEASSKKENVSSRYGDRSESSMPKRPTIPSSEPDDEPTTLEKIWQPFFKGGEPTPRLGQFLRGLALHLIEDYEPKHSLVVTPAKMKKFYEDIKLQEETYPWHNIFRLSNGQIAKVYRDMKCSHFYVQDRLTEPPTIPALTPEGFQRWMTLHIQAHPQAESERLAQAVRDMPINNADDPKERFPKELSRRLFPKDDDLKTRQYCSAALSADGQINLPKHTSFPPPPPPAAASNQTSSSFGDRERAPYGSVSSGGPSAPLQDSIDMSSSSEDERKSAFPSVPIERERKPYTAKEGTGKFYHNESGATSSRTLRPEPMVGVAAASSRHRPSSAFIERDLGNHSDGYRNDDFISTARPDNGLHRTYSKPSARRPEVPLSAGLKSKDNAWSESSTSFYASSNGDKDDERRRDRDRERERERDRDKDRERDRDRRSERDDRDREREKRDREAREREQWEKDEWVRRAEERLAYNDGEPLSRRTTLESGYPGSNVTPYGLNNGYPQAPLGTGERRYG